MKTTLISFKRIIRKDEKHFREAHTNVFFFFNEVLELEVCLTSENPVREVSIGSPVPW